MARRRAARCSPPGGDEIQALRQSRARLILGAAAVAGAALLAAAAALSAPRDGGLLAGIGSGAVLGLAAALVWRVPAGIAPALVLLGAEYAGLFLVREDTVDVRAPVYGAGFFVVAELAFAALELRTGGDERGLLARRAAVLTALALGSVVAGAVVLAAASVPLEGGTALQALGVVAAVAALLLLGRLAVRMQ